MSNPMFKNGERTVMWERKSYVPRLRKEKRYHRKGNKSGKEKEKSEYPTRERKRLYATKKSQGTPPRNKPTCALRS